MFADIIGDMDVDGQVNLLKMKFERIIEVPSNRGVQGPYLHHNAKEIKNMQKILGYEKDPAYFELFFDVEHQDVSQIMKAVQILKDEG